ncbi:predicted protein [Naegleria gruberi]|uniref:Predicted protein n=1 Tax=Naegleria gruberi TaxID=5762 RepID=D2VCB1_NAEGR|nr:uncharacterized protein NAEGRDRAFT_66508 [Naegleria gruberi]EFC45624.1 predicted protein [Naegleria gruberi]|eukprot:XP_002678368.1 predicted protein [Naegleria gruberi strain NEG-M]
MTNNNERNKPLGWEIIDDDDVTSQHNSEASIDIVSLLRQASDEVQNIEQSEDVEHSQQTRKQSTSKKPKAPKQVPILYTDILDNYTDFSFLKYKLTGDAIIEDGRVNRTKSKSKPVAICNMDHFGFSKKDLFRKSCKHFVESKPHLNLISANNNSIKSIKLFNINEMKQSKDIKFKDKEVLGRFLFGIELAGLNHGINGFEHFIHLIAYLFKDEFIHAIGTYDYKDKILKKVKELPIQEHLESLNEYIEMYEKKTFPIISPLKYIEEEQHQDLDSEEDQNEEHEHFNEFNTGVVSTTKKHSKEKQQPQKETNIENDDNEWHDIDSSMDDDVEEVVNIVEQSRVDVVNNESSKFTFTKKMVRDIYGKQESRMSCLNYSKFSKITESDNTKDSVLRKATAILNIQTLLKFGVQVDEENSIVVASMLKVLEESIRYHINWIKEAEKDETLSKKLKKEDLEIDLKVFYFKLNLDEASGTVTFAIQLLNGKSHGNPESRLNVTTLAAWRGGEEKMRSKVVM